MRTAESRKNVPSASPYEEIEAVAVLSAAPQ